MTNACIIPARSVMASSTITPLEPSAISRAVAISKKPIYPEPKNFLVVAFLFQLGRAFIRYIIDCA